MNDLDKDLRCVVESSGERHARTPTQSFEEYRESKYKDLETFVAARKTIYLDMNFWIAMRNPDESRNPVKARQLLNLLRRGVAERRFLCPVSYAVDSELMKQKPLERRLAQANIMDELSEGVAIRNPFNIAELEFYRFLAERSISFKNVPIASVWTRVGYMILGDGQIECSLLPNKFMELSNKVILDVLWCWKIEDVVKNIGACPQRERIAASINVARQIYPRNGKSFEMIFAGELRGALCGMASELDEDKRKFLVGQISKAVIKGLDDTAIPSQRINAALHAALRLDDNYKLTENDLDDIQHSSVAVGYCDVFLTDKPAADRLRRPAIKKLIPNKCKIISDFDEAISFLN